MELKEGVVRYYTVILASLVRISILLRRMDVPDTSMKTPSGSFSAATASCPKSDVTRQADNQDTEFNSMAAPRLVQSYIIMRCPRHVKDEQPKRVS